MSDCGTCTKCCTLLAVNEIEKPRCVDCVHIGGKGCTIYPFRPQSCREFECVWLQSQKRDDPMAKWLRPDRSGIVIAADGEDLILHVDPLRPESLTIFEPRFTKILNRWVRNGVRAFVLRGEKRTLVAMEKTK